MARERAIVFGSASRAMPSTVDAWLGALGVEVERIASEDDLMARALRGRPVAVLIDARAGGAPAARSAASRLKRDSFSAIVPVAVIVDDDSEIPATLEAGADETFAVTMPEAEQRARLATLLRRASRDGGVHPTTRLPGTVEIEEELDRRIARSEPFATCYADLDHFKEFNDRYGYNEGDRVIRMLATVIHDVAKGISGERAFVGHIGGDDFIFVLPLDDMAEVCATIVETFELLVPYQYNEADRRAGYYFGKDRRGMLHRVPLMSVSIGVVTTERRTFTRASQVSALASEMKSYAKAQPGSVYSVDRRHEPVDADAHDRSTTTQTEKRS